MYRFILFVLMFVSAGVSAETVTVDFNEITPVYSDGATGGPISVDSKGYTFASNGSNCAGGDTVWSVDSGGIFNQNNNFPEPGICEARVTMEKIDGGVFAILSADITLGLFGATTGSSLGDWQGSKIVYGLLDDGSTADLSGAIGTGDWLNLTFLSVTNDDQFGGWVNMDTVVVSAVPVPAAVWLFGSGLGLLGWMRRRL